MTTVNNTGRNVVVGTQWGDEGKGPLTHEGMLPSNSPTSGACQ